MKRIVARFFAISFVLSLLVLLAPALIAGPPERIQFQGVLTDGDDLPVSGMYRFVFSLYTDTTLAPIWTADDSISVHGGFYETLLDVAGIDFDTSYYIGVEVNGAAIGPKKPLASVPYALSSPHGAVAPSSIDTTGASAGEVLVFDGSAVVWDSVAGTKIADQQVVRSVNGLKDTIYLVAGDRMEIQTAGDSIRFSTTIASGGADADSDWTISGDDMYSHVAGNVGIGTAAPGKKLDVDGSIRSTDQLISTGPDGMAPIVVASSTLVDNLNADRIDGSHAADFAPALHLHDGADITTGVIDAARLPSIDDGDWTVSGDDVYIDSGRVGIGTSSPSVELDVKGSGRFSEMVTGEWYLSVGVGSAQDDDYIFFDSTWAQYLKWNDDSTRFELSSGLVLRKPLHVSTLQSPANRPYNYLSYDNLSSPVTGTLNDWSDLYMEGDFEAKGTIYCGSDARFEGNLYVGFNSPTGDDYLYMDNGSEYLRWQNDSTYFRLTDALATGGPLMITGTSVAPRKHSYSYFESSGNPSPASGQLSWASDVFVADDLEVYDDIFYSGVLTDLAPVPPMKAGGSAGITAAEAVDALNRLRPVTYRKTSIEGPNKQTATAVKLGFEEESIPALLAGAGGKGYRPIDLVVLLTKVVQEQQRRIEALEAKTAK